MDAEELTPRRPRAADVGALIGMLATLDGTLMTPEGGDELPEWAERLATRLQKDGLLGVPAGKRALRQTLNDLNHRLRYALGEYDEPPEPSPVP